MVDKKALYRWCSVPAQALASHEGLRIPLRIAADSAEMGRMMAEELVAYIRQAAEAGRKLRAILPCGPKCWYAPFAERVNALRLDLACLEVFHMDECLDWQGRLLHEDDPYNFKTFMLEHFYGPVDATLSVPEKQRHFLTPDTMEEIRVDLAEHPADVTFGGWGQDGHIAYNQTRRHPFSHITLEELENATVRIQDNNLDTIIALGQRTYGGAYQLVPPMSVTLGLKECLGAKAVRLFSDTGAWKQTALRVALFSDPDPEYPITLLQRHPDAVLTATMETASHPISENPEWKIAGVNA